MRSAFVVAVLILVPFQVGSQPVEAEAAAKAKIEAVLAAIRVNDPDKAVADWPAKAPGRATFHSLLTHVFPKYVVAAKLTEVGYSRWDVAEKTLTVRVRFIATLLGKDDRDLGRMTIVLNARFVRDADGVQWGSFTDATVDVAMEIGRAANRDEAIRIVRDNTDLPPDVFVWTLFNLCGNELRARRLPTARMVLEVMGEAAGKDQAAKAWTEMARGEILVVEGQPEKAAEAFEAAQTGFRKLGQREPAFRAGNALIGALLSANKGETALKHAEALLDLAREVESADKEATALHQMGLALQWVGKLAEAAKSYRQAAKISRELKDARGEAATLVALGEVERLLGDTEGAKATLKRAMELAEQTKSPYHLAGARVNLAVISVSAGGYDEAIAGFRQASAAFREVGYADGVLTAENGIGIVYMERGALDEALAQFKRTLELARTVGSVPWTLKVMTNYANAHTQSGQYGEALRINFEVRELAKKVNNREVLSAAVLNIGSLYSRTGQTKLAYEYWVEAAKAAHEIGNIEVEANAYRNLAEYLVAAGKFDEAREAYQTILKLGRAAGLIHLEISSATDLAGLLVVQGKEEEGQKLLDELLKRVIPLKIHVIEASVRSELGWALLRRGKLAEAEAQYQAAFELAEKTGSGNARYTARLGLGAIASSREKWADAAAHYRTAVEIAERLRHNARETSLQISQFEQLARPYVGLATCLAEAKEFADAFAVSERAKARSLVGILERDRKPLARGMNADQQKREAELRTLLGERTKVLELKSAAKAGAAEVNKAQQLVDDTQSDLDKFRQEVFLAHPELQTARAEFTPSSLKDLGTSLFRDRPGLVVVSYLVTFRQTFIFVLTPGENAGDPARLSVHKVEVKDKELCDAVRDFVGACQSPGPQPESKDLITWLLSPAEKEIAAARELVIVPDGPLHRLPFHALRDEDKRYLIERCPVSYAPSVTALVKITASADQKRKNGTAAASLAVGIGDFGKREKPLEAAEPEARAVEALFKKESPKAPVSLLLGRDATKAKVRKSWADCRYLHFATHGEFNPGAPLYSSILLSPDEVDEGRLYARDLLDAELAAELVVLSACSTGVGRTIQGEGLLGMSWSWFVAGVPSLVVSQWNVDDSSTSKLIGEFYTKLLSGATKAEALRQAQITLLKTKATRHPFFWAPFIIVGDPR